MFDLDHADTGRPNDNEVDLFCLTLMRDGERQVGQQNPRIVTLRILKLTFEMIECTNFAFVDRLAAGENGDFYLAFLRDEWVRLDLCHLFRSFRI